MSRVDIVEGGGVGPRPRNPPDITLCPPEWGGHSGRGGGSGPQPDPGYGVDITMSLLQGSDIAKGGGGLAVGQTPRRAKRAAERICSLGVVPSNPL